MKAVRNFRTLELGASVIAEHYRASYMGESRQGMPIVVYDKPKVTWPLVQTVGGRWVAPEPQLVVADTCPPCFLYEATQED